MPSVAVTGARAIGVEQMPEEDLCIRLPGRETLILSRHPLLPNRSLWMRIRWRPRCRAPIQEIVWPPLPFEWRYGAEGTSDLA